MALALPLALRLEANKLASTLPWLLLLELTLPDASVLRFVRNTEDIVFGGYTWTAYPFTLGDQGQSGDGKVQAVTLQAGNAARALTPYLEQYGGLVGSQVRLIVIHAGNLAADYALLTLAYDILACHISPDGLWVEWSLGAENPMRRRFPTYVVVPLHCAWVARFKGAECAYAGADASCKGTLTDCRLKSNSARFGGRPGITGAPRFV
jgi:phage-related protein